MQRVTISMDDELGEAFDGLIEGQGYAFLPGAKGIGNSTIKFSMTGVTQVCRPRATSSLWWLTLRCLPAEADV